jgi:hypothetical protein
VGIALFTISVLAVAVPILVWCCLKKKKEAAMKIEELKKKTLSRQQQHDLNDIEGLPSPDIENHKEIYSVPRKKIP